MAPIQVIMCLSLFLLSQLMEAQSGSTSLIRKGSSLQPDTNRYSWLSPSGRFAFGFYPQGNGFAVGIWLVNNRNNITVVWTANRDDPPVSSNSTVEFTKDGELILQTAQAKEGKEIASLPYDYEGTGVSASMLDSGNFVILDENSRVIWESFDSLTDTILGGQNLSHGLNLTSSRSIYDHSSGRFYLRFTHWGELAAYPANYAGAVEEFYWSIPNTGYESQYPRLTFTAGVLQLAIINVTVKVIANISYNSTKNETVIYRAIFDADGILRLYLHRFKMDGSSNVTLEWSLFQNQCEVKGFCGFNSYCSNNISGAYCRCFPGFDYINPNMTSSGCSRNFFDDAGCERKEPTMFYNIADMENTKLGGLPYSLLSVNEEDCKKSCLEDCHCGAAYYVDGACSKLKLPLMFGMKGENESGAVFIKWSSSNGSHVNQSNIPPPIQDESKKQLITIIAASMGSITFFCLLIAIYSILVYKLRINKYRKLPDNSNLGLSQEFSLRSFSYIELDQATDGFKEEIGRGSFGAVYKGSISEGQKIIAVKRLENLEEEEQRKFRAEMAIVRRTHHRNLVRLLGFCMEGSKKLLVYEYMSKGSLADLLFNVERRPLWRERVRIAFDVAKAILYLHEECEVQIVHCNIKPKNILVDDFGTAKISNFGLASVLMPIQTETISGVEGTRGYMAPEWQNKALISVKSDVYSFGVVLLEIACCRSNIEVNVETADEVLLSIWVHKCFMAEELNKLVQDQEEVDMKILERFVKVGLLCVQNDQTMRPTMKSVILMLEGTMDVPLPPFTNASVT